MLFIKNILKTLIFSVLIIGAVMACSSDSSGDTQNSEETIIEDITKLKDDSQFLEYIEQSVLSLDRINAPVKAQELIAKEPLTETENLELALALGFDNITQMEENYKNLAKNWMGFYKRFDLDKQEIEVVKEVMVETYLKRLLQNINESNKGGYALKLGPEDFLYPMVKSCNAACGPQYIDDLRNKAEWRFENLKKCYDSFLEHGDEDRWRVCEAKVLKIDEATLFSANNDYVCCLYTVCIVEFRERYGQIARDIEDGIRGECGSPIGR